MTPSRLAIRGLKKSFGANLVLRDLDLALDGGEVHALIGGNGAGKSTLSKIVAGIELPDAGELLLDGAAYHPRSRRAAQAAGVVMVLQELTVMPTLSVAENLFLETLPTRPGGWIDQRNLRQRARLALDRVGLTAIDPDTPTAQLGIGQQQLMEMAAALEKQCRLLILDEPTAALSGGEVETLFALLRQLRAAGTTILYITHRLDELPIIADRISVLRDGRLVATFPGQAVTRKELITAMSAESVAPGMAAAAAGVTQGEVVLRVSGLSAGFVRDISFELRRGEIVGFGGLVGAGRTELLRAIFGADPMDGGIIEAGSPLRRVAASSTAAAREAGFAFIPEDRKAHGILAPLSVTANATIARLPRRRGIPGWIDRRAEARESGALFDKLALRYRDLEQPIAELSGGNQQKIVIGRWLRADAPIWLLDEPTRGVDVRAREAIHRLLRERAEAGAAFLLASSDYEELSLICDRVLVLSGGRLAAEFPREELNPTRFMAAAFAAFATASAR